MLGIHMCDVYTAVLYSDLFDLKFYIFQSNILFLKILDQTRSKWLKIWNFTSLKELKYIVYISLHVFQVANTKTKDNSESKCLDKMKLDDLKLMYTGKLLWRINRDIKMARPPWINSVDNSWKMTNCNASPWLKTVDCFFCLFVFMPLAVFHWRGIMLFLFLDLFGKEKKCQRNCFTFYKSDI